MPPLLNRYATPLTIGLFAVSAISGIALFLHVGQGVFNGMHEWLSMLLLLPFALHMWRNWAAVTGYLRRRTLLVPLALSLVVALGFGAPGALGLGGREPPAVAIQLLSQAPLDQLAPVLKTTPDALRARLAEKGYRADSSDISIAQVAAAANAAPARVLFAILPAPSAGPAR